MSRYALIFGGALAIFGVLGVGDTITVGGQGIEIAFPQMDIHVRSPAPQLREDPAQPLRIAGTSG